MYLSAISYRRFIGILAGASLVIQICAQPAAENAPPPPAFGSAPPSNSSYIDLGGDPNAPPRPRPGTVATPPPASGSRDGFFYAPSKSDPGMTVVYPADGSEPLYVSKSFADLALKSPGTDQQILNDFKHYEQMNATVQKQFMDQFFPDSTAPDANVQRNALQGTDRDVIIEQDPQAGPYARVTVTDKEGNVLSQSSVSAQVALQMLNQKELSADERIDALLKSDFALPESARLNFDDMTSAQLHAIVIEKPELQRQEFVKVAKAAAARENRGAEDFPPTTATTSFAESTTDRAQLNSYEAPETTDTIDTAAADAEPAPEEADEPDAADSDGQSWGALLLAGIAALVAGGVFVWALRSRD